MKRYLLFSGKDFYPEGGMSDFISDFDRVIEAINYINNRINEHGVYETDDEAWEYKWAHVYDTQERKIVWNSSTN